MVENQIPAIFDERGAGGQENGWPAWQTHGRANARHRIPRETPDDRQMPVSTVRSWTRKPVHVQRCHSNALPAPTLGQVFRDTVCVSKCS